LKGFFEYYSKEFDNCPRRATSLESFGGFWVSGKILVAFRLGAGLLTTFVIPDWGGFTKTKTACFAVSVFLFASSLESFGRFWVSGKFLVAFRLGCK